MLFIHLVNRWGLSHPMEYISWHLYQFQWTWNALCKCHFAPNITFEYKLGLSEKEKSQLLASFGSPRQLFRIFGYLSFFIHLFHPGNTFVKLEKTPTKAMELSWDPFPIILKVSNLGSFREECFMFSEKGRAGWGGCPHIYQGGQKRKILWMVFSQKKRQFLPCLAGITLSFYSGILGQNYSSLSAWFF